MKLCSECENEIAPERTTCSPRCRSRRHRRLHNGRSPGRDKDLKPYEAGAVEEQAALAIRERIAPVVREALTEDVLKSISDLVKLTPAAVEAIEEDLASTDKNLRQRAYMLLSKYTFGHPSLVPEMSSDKQVVVLVNGVARPGVGQQPDEDLAVPQPLDTTATEAEEIRECDTCHADKPASEFVGNSHRCQDCFTRQRDHAHRITERA